MSKALILVTGATGKTGANVVEQLIERGFTVRALARSRDDRSKKLERVVSKYSNARKCFPRRALRSTASAW